MRTKFEIGDMVIANKKANDQYNITREGFIGTVTNYDYPNEKIVIQTAKGEHYVVDPECFDLVEQKILIHRDKKDPKKVIARNLATGKTAEAKCAPDDKFDFEKGAELAFGRLINEKSKEKKKPFNAKVVCVENGSRSYYFTVGKVYFYNGKDGTLTDNTSIPWRECFVDSVDELNGVVGNGVKFIEFKGE